MTQYRTWLVIILLITVVSVWIDLPNNGGIHLDIDRDGEDDITANFVVVQGLDLQGGSRVLLKPEINDFTADDLRVAKDIVERRVNGLGLTEAVVQVQGDQRILVELPGVSDRDVALNTVQSTGLLEFVDYAGISPTVIAMVSQEGACILTTEQVRLQQARDAADDETSTPPVTTIPTETPIPPDQITPEVTPGLPPFGKLISANVTPAPAQDDGDSQERGPCPDGSFPLTQDGTPNGEPFRTVMTGSGLRDAAPLVDQFGRRVVSFTLTDEGDQIFSAHTSANVGQLMAIVLDGVVISAPNINQPITGGSGQIEGSFTDEEARILAVQLRYGALPVPLEVAAFDNIGPTLGEISVQRSIRAGVIGVVVVLMFMMIYYRVPGIAAALALIVFGLINFAIYKSIPVTLTLPAITGFLISIGTAVDGNILIFERMKEELRAGRNLENAVRQGFERAWTSIRDSNISTLLICGILYFFGDTFGASTVQGFAITLGLGLIINLFTAVIVTRTFLAVILDLFGDALEGSRRLLGV
jgi:protein-export membrane protein SecD